MATGRWNHTAAMLAAQCNLARIVGGMFSGKSITLISERDVHPYRRPSEQEQLNKEFVARLQEIASKLPRAERKEARERLIREFREQAKRR